MSIKRLSRLLEVALNEGPGAAVEFEFRGADLEPIANELGKFKVTDLYVASYYDRRKVYGEAGTLEIDLDSLKDEMIEQIDGLTYDDKAEIQLIDIGIESCENYFYGAGYSRFILDEKGFNTDPEKPITLCVTYKVTDEGEEGYEYIEDAFRFIPSADCLNEYDLLDEIEDEEEFEESINEDVDEHTEIKCRMYARLLEKINEKFGTLIGTFKVEPLYTDKYELGLKRGYGRYDFKFVSDDAFLPLKNKSLEEQAEYLKKLILGKKVEENLSDELKLKKEESQYNNIIAKIKEYANNGEKEVIVDCPSKAVIDRLTKEGFKGEIHRGPRFGDDDLLVIKI